MKSSRILFLILFYSYFSFSFSISSANSTNSDNQLIDVALKNNEIIFTAKKFPKYRIFNISQPERLVIDFGKTKLAKKINIKENPFFQKVRTNDRDGDLRIVFDSKQKLTVKKSAITNPTQNSKNYKLTLIIDDSKILPITPLNSLIADKILGEENKTKSAKNVKKSNATKKITKPIIVIDAGHGGKDPGAIGKYARTKEKNVTLSFAKELKKALDKSGKFKTYLTRNKDYFIPLRGRVAKARKLRANLFISLHADSAKNRKAKGLSIYTLSEKSSDKEAAKLAEKENKSDIIGGVNFSGTSGDILKTLISLSQRNSMNNSAQFAEIAIKTLKLGGVEVKQNTHRFAGFRVLTAPDMASVLIELGYLSNRHEERRLNNISYRRKISKYIAKAAESYFRKVKE